MEYEYWLLLFEIPNCDETVLMASYYLSTWRIAPLQAAHILVTLQRQDNLTKSFSAICSQIEDTNGAILAACYDEVLSRTKAYTLDLAS